MRDLNEQRPVVMTLREAEQEPQAEPVAWIFPRAYGSGLSFNKPTKPEKWDDDYGEWYCKPLYAHPPPQRNRALESVNPEG